MSAFNGVKVFCATVTSRRQSLGEEVTQWLQEARQQPGFQVVDIAVRQSSDAAFHCLSIVVFFQEGHKSATGRVLPPETGARSLSDAARTRKHPAK